VAASPSLHGLDELGQDSGCHAVQTPVLALVVVPQLRARPPCHNPLSKHRQVEKQARVRREREIIFSKTSLEGEDPNRLAISVNSEPSARSQAS
jgi:hypothetical protein